MTPLVGPPTLEGLENAATAQELQLCFHAVLHDTSLEHASLCHSGVSYRNRTHDALSLVDRLQSAARLHPSVLARVRMSLSRNDVSIEGPQGWYGLGDTWDAMM